MALPIPFLVSTGVKDSEPSPIQPCSVSPSCRRCCFSPGLSLAVSASWTLLFQNSMWHSPGHRWRRVLFNRAGGMEKKNLWPQSWSPGYGNLLAATAAAGQLCIPRLPGAAAAASATGPDRGGGDGAGYLTFAADREVAL